ncbi:MAG: hypothetical protein K8H86_04795, partial [Ignavibacteriaceae bacterium]|nr:hypothetical protein [Ignavibacteriaceae bacterium]
MVFNPLFLNAYTTTDSMESLKTSKFANQNYLFSDIIKVCFDKPADANQLLVNNASLSDSNLNSGMLPSASLALNTSEIKDVKQVLQNLVETIAGKKNLSEVQSLSDEKTAAASNETELVSGEVVLSLLNQLSQLTKTSGEPSKLTEVNGEEFNKELEKLKAIISSTENENGCKIVFQLENKEYILNIQPVKNLKKTINDELGKIEGLINPSEIISLNQAIPIVNTDSKLNSIDNSQKENNSALKSDENLILETSPNIASVVGDENEEAKTTLSLKSSEQQTAANFQKQSIPAVGFINSTEISTGTDKKVVDTEIVSFATKDRTVIASDIKVENANKVYSKLESINPVAASKMADELIVDEKINTLAKNNFTVVEDVKSSHIQKTEATVDRLSTAAGTPEIIKDFEAVKADLKPIQTDKPIEFKQDVKVVDAKNISFVQPEEATVESSPLLDPKEIKRTVKFEDTKNVNSVNLKEVNVETSLIADLKEVKQSVKTNNVKNITPIQPEAVNAKSTPLVNSKEKEQTISVEAETNIISPQPEEVKGTANNQSAVEVKKAAPQLYKIAVEAKQIKDGENNN